MGSAGLKSHSLLTAAEAGLSPGGKTELSKEVYFQSRRMAQWVKVPGTKPDGGSWITQSHMVEGEDQL